MTRFILTFTFLLSTLIGISQLQIHGTMVIASVASDGIVIAADSRLGLETEYGIVTTVDNYQKIFISDKFAFAFMGSAFYHSVSAKKIVEAFTSYKQQFSSPNDCLAAMIIFLKYKFKINENEIGLIVCCGYDTTTHQPLISFYNKKQMYYPDLKPFISDTTEYIFKNKYNPNMTSMQIRDLAIKAIDSFTILNTQFENIIGGPVNVLRINPNSTFQWLTNNRTFYVNTQIGMAKYYFDNKKEFKIIRPDLLKGMEQLFHQMLETARKKSQ